MRLVLTGGTVVGATGSRVADVRIVDGVVTEVGPVTPGPEDEVVDCTGCLLVPGGVDPHTHLDLEAGPIVTADDFATGTRAALAGGTTTVLDFATQFHGESLQRGLERWHAKADGRAVCDYGFHLAMTEWRPEFAEQMAAVADAGVTSFKMYLAYRHSMMVEDDEVFAALTASASLGATIGFHCENGRVIDALVHEELAQGHTGAYWHQATRPPELEAEAVDRVTTIAALTDAMHYVVHLSARQSVDALRHARSRGSRVVAETCPQYLVLDNRAYGTADVDAAGELEARKVVMSPPLRPPDHHGALWTALAGGDIQFVGTDHCSFDVAGQKDAAADFTSVPNGAPGIELRMILLYSDGVAAGRLTPERYVAVTSANAARHFGIYPRKGAIAPGSDADVVVIDPAPRWTVRHAGLHENVDHTPYEGHEVQGRVREVLLRGRRVVDGGVLRSDLRPGQFLRCGPPDDDIH
jgi:dihydropyrimidinase